MNIFVSYTTRDSYVDLALLEATSDYLSEFSNPYIDILHNDSIDKQSHVENMLCQSNIVLLLESLSINNSKWVQWELNEASNKGIPVINIPVSLNPATTLDRIKKSLNR